MSEQIEFKPIYLQKNQGHGNARRISLESCSNELVAFMDADDISLKDRFRLQLERFMENRRLSIVGGQISEFSGNESNITGIRKVPEAHYEIVRYAKKHCPMNQVSVMFRTPAVDAVGGYIDWYCEEDYYLWLRILKNGFLFENVPEILVNVRAGEEMSSRRGGWEYFRSEERLQRYMLKKHTISLGRYIFNVIIRFSGEVILTNRLREKAFKLFRENEDIFEEKATKGENTIRLQHIDDEKGAGTLYPPFSVAICVYGKDNAKWFDKALESIIVNQTVKPSEVVLVVDGPIPEEIEKVIEKYAQICRGGVLLKVIRFSENRGLGQALRVCIENCENELIARMDSDDIAVFERFELQLKRMVSENVDICGGQIEEFISTPDEVVGKRIVPETDSELKAYMRKRCPFNHMTVMYKKSSVMEAGNYQDWFWNEDYYLWIRMALKKNIFANLPDTLVKVRVGKDMYARRGGDRYFKSEIGIQRMMLEKGIIDRPTYLSNCAKRFILQKMMPNNVRGWVFKKFARS